MPTPQSLKMHFHIILPSKPGSSNVFLSLRFPHQNLVYTSPLPIRATFPAHLILPIRSPQQYWVSSTVVPTVAWGWSSTKLSPDGHGGGREKNVGGWGKADSKSSVLDLDLGMRSWAATSLNVYANCLGLLREGIFVEQNWGSRLYLHLFYW